MKMQPFTASLQKHSLISLTSDMRMKADKQWVAGDETYNTIIENSFIAASKYPNTSLVLNVDRASYSNIRRFINMNSQVPPDAVRIEEMLNYFNFNYTDPVKDSVFKVESSLTSCPWTPGNQLLFLQVNTRKLELDKVPPATLYF